METRQSSRDSGKPAQEVSEPRILSSWKEIADYLHVSPRTAQQYEKTRGLPVKRLGNRPNILESDLRAWQLSSLSAPPWWERTRLLQAWAAVSTALLLISVAAFLVLGISSWDTSSPVSIQWQGPVLRAFDSRGRVLWSRVIQHPVMPSFEGASPSPWFGDLDADGKVETVLVFPHIKREEEGWDLHCLSVSGDTIWTLRVSRVVSDRSSSFKPPYVLRGFSASWLYHPSVNSC